MNQIFSIKRFVMLFKKHTVENYKIYLLSMAVLAGILLLFLGTVSYNGEGYLPHGPQFAFFISFLLISGCVFTSLSFADLGNKKEAIPALTLPASHFEKYLVSWIYSYVIFQVLYVAMFYLIASIIVQLGLPSTPLHENSVINIFSTEIEPHPYYAFIIYTFLHAITFFGAIYFERLHFIKTAFAFFIIVFLLGLINRPILSSMFNQQVDGTSIFSPVNISNGKNAYSIYPVSVQHYWYAILLALIVLILWVSTYFRLKEKEV